MVDILSINAKNVNSKMLLYSEKQIKILKADVTFFNQLKLK